MDCPPWEPTIKHEGPLGSSGMAILVSRKRQTRRPWKPECMGNESSKTKIYSTSAGRQSLASVVDTMRDINDWRTQANQVEDWDETLTIHQCGWHLHLDKV